MSWPSEFPGWIYPLLSILCCFAMGRWFLFMSVCVNIYVNHSLCRYRYRYVVQIDVFCSLLPWFHFLISNRNKQIAAIDRFEPQIVYWRWQINFRLRVLPASAWKALSQFFDLSQGHQRSIERMGTVSGLAWSDADCLRLKGKGGPPRNGTNTRNQWLLSLEAWSSPDPLSVRVFPP